MSLVCVDVFPDLLTSRSKKFSIVSKDMIQEKFSDVHGVGKLEKLKSTITS